MKTGTIIFNNEISVLENLQDGSIKAYNLKYKDIAELNAFDEFIMSVNTKQKDKRTKQVEELNFMIKKIMWIGEKPTDNTRIVFKRIQDTPETIDINIEDWEKDLF